MSKNSKVKISVSIVEDEVSVRQILAGWIQQADSFRYVSDYGSAEEALLHLAQQQPEVVLMDINLPGMSGIECVRKLKPLLPQTQFVMLTVYEDADNIFNALAAGACGYLLKQTPRNELLTSLKEVHAGGSPMTINIARKVVQSFQSPPSQGQPAGQAPDDLSPRERAVIQFLTEGYLYKEIAENLNISVPTVNTYIRRIYEKLHVRSRSQAVAKYMHYRGAEAAHRA